MLNPSAPEEGEDKLEMYNQKFGPARVAAIIPAMTVGGEPRELGLGFRV
jgi:hypothetical protein